MSSLVIIIIFVAVMGIIFSLLRRGAVVRGRNGCHPSSNDPNRDTANPHLWLATSSDVGSSFIPSESSVNDSNCCSNDSCTNSDCGSSSTSSSCDCGGGVGSCD